MSDVIQGGPLGNTADVDARFEVRGSWGNPQRGPIPPPPVPGLIPLAPNQQPSGAMTPEEFDWRAAELRRIG
jgi:hypothetical protein